MSEELAFQLSGDDINKQLSEIDGINIEELREMNYTIISEANRLTKNVKKFTNRIAKGEKIPKEEQEEQAAAWKQVREMERAYAFLLKKAKQKGIKQKDIESDDGIASPDIEKIKKQDGTIGAIVRKMTI